MASHLLTQTAQSEFVGVEHCWSIQLFLAKQIYIREDGYSILCLGHATWGFVGWPVSMRVVGVENVFIPEWSETTTVSGKVLLQDLMYVNVGLSVMSCYAMSCHACWPSFQ